MFISQRGLNAGWSKRRRIINGYPLQVDDQGVLVIFHVAERVRSDTGKLIDVVLYHTTTALCSARGKVSYNYYGTLSSVGRNLRPIGSGSLEAFTEWSHPIGCDVVLVNGVCMNLITCIIRGHRISESHPRVGDKSFARPGG
jgi:hypothetical protein